VQFGLANTEVAGIILADWRFPPEIIAAIREHYLTAQADYNNRMACLLNIAGRVVAEAGHTLPGDRKFWEYDARKLEILEINDEQQHRAGDRARAMFERLRASLA
jgi:HD-like signal output (HDOD) protein